LAKIIILQWTQSPVTLTDDEEFADLAAILKQRPPDEIQWGTMIEKESMERHVQQYNRQSFSAASESPCGHGFRHDTLTFTSLSPEAQKILDILTPASVPLNGSPFIRCSTSSSLLS
jgi:hypothetical protein